MRTIVSAALMMVAVATIVTTIPVVVWLPSEIRFVIGLVAGIGAAQAATGVLSTRRRHDKSKSQDKNAAA